VLVVLSAAEIRASQTTPHASYSCDTYGNYLAHDCDLRCGLGLRLISRKRIERLRISESSLQLHLLMFGTARVAL